MMYERWFTVDVPVTVTADCVEGGEARRIRIRVLAESEDDAVDRVGEALADLAEDY